MKTNALGQVKAENPILQQLVDMGLGEEPGPVCVICREGYRFQPGRVLAIYTFSRRCQLEDLESQLWYGSPHASSTASSPPVSSGRACEFWPCSSQHLPPGMHRSSGHRIRVYVPRPEVAHFALRAGTVFQ
ncbi:hypothetical protein OUZ56_003023 [Daphnia magna]|uniref:E3 ubiquitin ligase UBR4 C-terminal domain-containing protein n=1 Tax=Daphnia magna TaxID=35525 RepID=A0ABR0A7H6_9CRUS|nr:hypothetical protein OUZ56_003023 [Daphnia magna]